MAKFKAPGFSIDTDQIESIDQYKDETVIRIRGLKFVIPPQIGIILEGYWNYLAESGRAGEVHSRRAESHDSLERLGQIGRREQYPLL